MITHPQASFWVAKEAFAFCPGGSKRIVKVKAGDRFWVTNTQVNQTATGSIKVARANAGCPGYGWAFSPADFTKYFTAWNPSTS